MLRHIAAFEWRYQVKSPVFWVGFLIFFLMAFGSVTVDTIQIGGRGNVNINSPFAILQTQAILSIFMVFVFVAMVAGVILRDDETGFAPILRATRITRASYLVGRFGGAIAAALAVMASVPLAILAGSMMPWLDAEKIGPLHLAHYAYALFAFGLPTLLIVGAVFFALATVTRSMMWTYVGAVAMIVLYLVMRGVLRDPAFDTVSALSDPFGISALSITTKYWTAAERNTQLPALSGLMLANRLIWMGVAAALFALTWRLFRFETPRSGAGTKASEEDAAPPAISSRSGALAGPSDDVATRWTQFGRLARFDMAFVFRSPAFFVLLGIGVINSAGAMWFTGEHYGSPSFPVTRLMTLALLGAFAIMPMIIAIYYGGELVWRDRERRMHEIIDATAAPDWAHLLPKIAAIALVLAATVLVAVLTGIVVQALKGYTNFDLPAYLLWFALPTMIAAVHLAVLSVFVQVLVPQKFIGWGVMLLQIVAAVAMASAGWEHNLYNYGGTPSVPLSDMNRMGRFWHGAAWFQLYWTGFAMVLATLAYALWRRGTTTALRPRLRQIGQRLRGAALLPLVLGMVIVIGAGGYGYYNTNMLNIYITAPEREERIAEMEKALLPFEKIPQPRITGVTLDVQIYPQDTRIVTRGSYRIENRSSVAIDVIHVRWPEHSTLDVLELDQAKIDKEYPRFQYRIYRLAQPMQPGEKRELRFTTTLRERGFPNAAPLTGIVDNGSFVNNFEITPAIGMSREGLLTDRAKRRKYGLPPDLRPPTLEDERGRAKNVLRADSDWVEADISVTTDADQVPIAPGYTVSDKTDGGRRSVHFKPDAPLNHFFSIQSARYAIARDKLNVAGKDIDLAVYHHPGHEANVKRMLEAMKMSLALFSEKFSPYQFRQARVIEFPAYADFAQSFANTIPYSENLGFISHHKDAEKIDLVTYVTAHEIGHQWWGHQLVSSEQQGATMLIETFAQYSALLVMEKMYGRDQVRRFLKYELDSYLRSRGGETLEELPIARVENQAYIHYRKGTLTMYWLKEVVGEEVVNRSMAKLLQEFAFKPAPYPNTTDFLRILRAEAGPQHDALITDLFEKITIMDVKARDAKAVKRADGRWDVSFEVEARKLYADGKGKETEAPLDEAFDIGVFTAEPGKKDFKADSVLLFERRQVKTGKQTITLVTAREPAYVGVDPYNKRIDRNSDDNLAKVGQ